MHWVENKPDQLLKCEPVDVAAGCTWLESRDKQRKLLFLEAIDETSTAELAMMLAHFRVAVSQALIEKRKRSQVHSFSTVGLPNRN